MKRKILIISIIIFVVIIALVLIVIQSNRHNNYKVAYINDNKANESISSIDKNNIENFVATNIETKEKQEINNEQKENNKETKEKNSNIQGKNEVAVNGNNNNIQNNKNNQETNENKNIQNKNSEKTNDKVAEKETNENEVSQKEEDNTKEEQKNENTEEKVSELAGKHYNEYNKTKTQHVVDYLNNKIKQLDGYDVWGGKAIVVTSKPTNSWFSYSYDEKLDGLATIGCVIKVYIEDEYVYDNRGNPYLYDTKAYIYTE